MILLDYRITAHRRWMAMAAVDVSIVGKCNSESRRAQQHGLQGLVSSSRQTIRVTENKVCCKKPEMFLDGRMIVHCCAALMLHCLPARRFASGCGPMASAVTPNLPCRKPSSVISAPTCASAGADSPHDTLLDVNRLQTQLSKAVAAEDFTEAARIRDQLTDVCGEESTSRTGWTGLGVPDWLADRAERLGFVMPTEIQHRAIKLFLLGADVLLRAHTGSGKTLAFVMPVLSMLEYPPLVYALHLPMLFPTPVVAHQPAC